MTLNIKYKTQFKNILVPEENILYYNLQGLSFFYVGTYYLLCPTPKIKNLNYLNS